jgi:hypothetical protein
VPIIIILLFPGKGGDRLAAEFNFNADPEAAYITLQELKCRTTIISWETSKTLGVSWVGIFFYIYIYIYINLTQLC